MKLIAPKGLHLFEPEEFREYVRSLHFKKEKKKSPAAKKKPKPPFTYRLNKKGTLILKVNRNPKWLSRAEIDGIATATGLPANVVWRKVMDPKYKIKLSTQDIEDSILSDLRDFPW